MIRAGSSPPAPGREADEQAGAQLTEEQTVAPWRSTPYGALARLILKVSLNLGPTQPHPGWDW